MTIEIAKIRAANTGTEFGAYIHPATVIAMCDEIERLRREVNALNAARFAYASEFPLNADGEPDVGSIHQNIRAMRKDAARYRWLADYLVGDRTDLDDAIVAASEAGVDQLTDTIDKAMGPEK